MVNNVLPLLALSSKQFVCDTRFCLSFKLTTDIMNQRDGATHREDYWNARQLWYMFHDRTDVRDRDSIAGRLGYGSHFAFSMTKQEAKRHEVFVVLWVTSTTSKSVAARKASHAAHPSRTRACSRQRSDQLSAARWRNRALDETQIKQEPPSYDSYFPHGWICKRCHAEMLLSQLSILVKFKSHPHPDIYAHR